MDMTRTEHLQWCKDRAIQEYDYGVETQDHAKGVGGAIASMTSDLNKHVDTQGSALMAGTLGMGLVGAGSMGTRKQVIEWINGFN